jgi:hypothetical protein
MRWSGRITIYHQQDRLADLVLQTAQIQPSVSAASR